MNIETHPREIGFVLRGHCQNSLDDPCINDLPSRVKSTVRLFAGDCLLYEGLDGGVCCSLFFKSLAYYSSQ